MKDFNTLVADRWQEQQERALDGYAKAFPAMVEAAQAEVDLSIMKDDDYYNECLHEALDLESTRIAIFHGDAEELGKNLIAKTRELLFNYHIKAIEEDWQNYVD
jgi:predicted Zn-dependent protease